MAVVGQGWYREWVLGVGLLEAEERDLGLVKDEVHEAHVAHRRSRCYLAACE